MRALIEATCDRLLVLDGNGGAQHFQGRFSQSAQRDGADTGPAQIGRIDTQLMDAEIYSDGERCRGLQQEREALRKTTGRSRKNGLGGPVQSEGPQGGLPAPVE